MAVILCLLATHSAHSQSGLRVVVYASGLSLPVAIVQDPTNAAVQFVVEQGGRIRAVQAGQVLPTDFLDLRGAISAGGERGLLGMAFAPDYAASGRFFVNFTNPSGHTVVARFTAIARTRSSPTPRRGSICSSAASRFIAQPFANHNGGHLAFGPDGYLYIGLGDGGSGERSRPSRAESRPSSSARCCASTSTSPTAIPTDTASRRTTRSHRAIRSAPGRKSGASACAIRGAIRSTIPRAAAPAR